MIIYFSTVCQSIDLENLRPVMNFCNNTKYRNICNSNNPVTLSLFMFCRKMPQKPGSLITFSKLYDLQMLDIRDCFYKNLPQLFLLLKKLNIIFFPIKKIFRHLLFCDSCMPLQYKNLFEDNSK